MTTKGFLAIHPDRLLVWNEPQIKDAMIHHKVSERIMRVTGPGVFDHWFSGLVPTSRAEFCASHGLDPNKPFILYLGSPYKVVGDELPLVLGPLREALSASPDAKIRNIQLIYRAHFSTLKIAAEYKFPGVFVVPKKAQIPDSGENLQLFYDSLYHAMFSTGISNSAMLDTICVGRPVVAVMMVEKYKKIQEGAQHFRQLLDMDAVEIANTPDEFTKIAVAHLDGQDAKKTQREAFFKTYLRPLGVEKLAGEAVADEIERLVL